MAKEATTTGAPETTTAVVIANFRNTASVFNKTTGEELEKVVVTVEGDDTPHYMLKSAVQGNLQVGAPAVLVQRENKVGDKVYNNVVSLTIGERYQSTEDKMKLMAKLGISFNL